MRKKCENELKILRNPVKATGKLAMDIEFAQELCELNNRFYRTWASSFSGTRHNTWPGWGRCLEETGFSAKEPQDATSADSPIKPPLTVLDVACGNLRFEGFLARNLPNRNITTYALDACDELALDGVSLPGNVAVRFQHCDVIKELQTETLNRALNSNKPADLTVSFGFMHHIPLPEWRKALLNALLYATAPSGYVCISLWQFLNDQGLAAKAKNTTAKGIAELGYNSKQFNEGDRLLGWKNEPGAYRYCHSFSDSEIDELIESVSTIATLKARFQSDGRTGNLNEYLVLQRCTAGNRYGCSKEHYE